MRAFLLIASLCTFLAGISLADPPTEAQLMGEAQRAYVGGDYDTATQLFTQVIEQDPQNTLAVQYLRNIRQRLAGQAAQQDPLKGLVLPQINFKDATFSSALDFFKQAAAKQSVTVSFVPNLPPEQLNRPVTLNLTQVPFLDALGYLCQLDGSTYKVEKFAIVITPAAPAGADASQPAPAPPQ